MQILTTDNANRERFRNLMNTVKFNMIKLDFG